MIAPQQSAVSPPRLRLSRRGVAGLAAAATVAGGLFAFGVTATPAHAAASRATSSVDSNSQYTWLPTPPSSIAALRPIQ